MDPVHSIGVLPLGVWLGIVAWLTDSVWPSIVCHTVNNAYALIAMRLSGASPETHLKFDAEGLTFLAISGVLAALALWVMWKYRKRASTALSNQLPVSCPSS
jgi:hypothetical protein